MFVVLVYFFRKLATKVSVLEKVVKEVVLDMRDQYMN